MSCTSLCNTTFIFSAAIDSATFFVILKPEAKEHLFCYCFLPSDSFLENRIKVFPVRAPPKSFHGRGFPRERLPKEKISVGLERIADKNNSNSEVHMKESVFKSYDELPLFLSAETVSKLLGISISSTYELMQENDFPVLRIGNRKVVPKDRFRAWVDRFTGGNQ